MPQQLGTKLVSLVGIDRITPRLDQNRSTRVGRVASISDHPFLSMHLFFDHLHVKSPVTPFPDELSNPPKQIKLTHADELILRKLEQAMDEARSKGFRVHETSSRHTGLNEAGNAVKLSNYEISPANQNDPAWSELLNHYARKVFSQRR